MCYSSPEILCDAMLGGLARWLRAAGYDAEFTYGIADRSLIRRADQMGAIILSSDGQLFERNIIRHGTIKALFVPRGMGKQEQLSFVLEKLKLPVRPQPRCMTCGGELAEVEKDAVRDEVPPKAHAACECFWRCRRCDKIFWRGTHWRSISKVLAAI